MMMDGYGMGAAGWIVMTFAWLVLLVVIVVVLIRIFPSRNDGAPSASPDAPSERPLEILDRRLASGEIDLETYDRLRERLVAASRGR